MAFVQIIECETSKIDDVKRLTSEWEEATQGKRTARRAVLGHDPERSEHFYEMVFFDSSDEAARNSELPETQEFARKLTDLLGREPTFRNIEVIEDHDLA